MSQNELQRVVAELDELIARDEEQQDYCSETGPNEAMRRVVALIGIRRRLIAAASRIEAAQAVAPGGVLVPQELLADLLARDGSKQFNGECGCINHSRKAEREYEAGRCPHQRLAAMLAAAPASEAKGHEVVEMGPNFVEEIVRNGEPTGYLLFGLVPRFRQAVRSLAGWKGEKPTVYAEDIETLVEVLRELESKPTASSEAGESDPVQRAVDDAIAKGQDPYLAGITAMAKQSKGPCCEHAGTFLCACGKFTLIEKPSK